MPRSEPIKAVRGMRDLLPRERPIWRAAEHAAEDVARRFGYEEIVTPPAEHAELIERVGEDTDAVAKELYRFEDRGCCAAAAAMSTISCCRAWCSAARNRR